MKRFSLTIRLIRFRLVVGYVFALVAAATMIVSCSFGFEETQTIALIEPTAASVTRSMTAAVQTEPTSSVTPSSTATELTNESW